MNIDKNYRIITDDFQFILQRRRTKKNKTNKQDWQTIGYFKEIAHALHDWKRHHLRSEWPSTLEELLKRHDALSTQIEAIGAECKTLWGVGPR